MIGFGYDVHRLVQGIPLVIGGVIIDYEFGLLGHSDGDVLIHAVIDAVLGATGKGDIGARFPDTDERYRGIKSTELLKIIMNEFDKNLKIINIDSTIVSQEPKMREKYSTQMEENLANLCKINLDQVNVKFKTEEKLGFTGKIEGMKAYAICQLETI